MRKAPSEPELYPLRRKKLLSASHGQTARCTGCRLPSLESGRKHLAEGAVHGRNIQECCAHLANMPSSYFTQCACTSQRHACRLQQKNLNIKPQEYAGFHCLTAELWHSLL